MTLEDEGKEEEEPGAWEGGVIAFSLYAAEYS